MHNPVLKALITNLLNDEEGISSDAYSSLLDYLAHIKEYDLVHEVNNCVQSINGRYYFRQAVELDLEDPQKLRESGNDYEYSWKDPSKPQNW